MTSPGLYVDPEDLRAKATQIQDLEFTSPQQRPHIVPADKLPLSTTAAGNVDRNASALYRYQAVGAKEGLRLAETLRSVADAYADVDGQARAYVEGNGPAPKPVVPKANDTDSPSRPDPLEPQAAVSAGGVSLVETTQRALSEGDTGASLRSAAQAWIANGSELRASGEAMQQPIPNWEGEAAQEAYRKFKEFGDWLTELGSAWDRLAGEAMALSDAHVTAMLNHTPIYQRYMELQAQMQAAAANQNSSAAHQFGEKMMSLQQDSDDLRERYASESTSQPVQPPEPPTTTAPTAPVTTNGTRPSNQPAPTGGGGAGAGSGGGSGQAPRAGGPPTAQTSPMSADPSQQSKGGEGTSSGGGSPSGGDSPSGGGSGSGGGMPSLPSDKPGGDEKPVLPGDPRLSPAAGSGGGGSGGGGAGGAGSPLQPSVSGVAVGPPPSAGGGGVGVGPSAATAGGGMMGGMGGMPMQGPGQQGGAGEKKRSPGVAPDEDLYTEDRPHTEGIIGRPERRAGQGKKDST